MNGPLTETVYCSRLYGKRNHCSLTKKLRTSNFGHFSKMGPNWKYLPKLSHLLSKTHVCSTARSGLKWFYVRWPHRDLRLVREAGRGFPPVCFLTVPAGFLCRLRRLSIRSVKSRSCCFLVSHQFHRKKKYSIEIYRNGFFLFQESFR